MTDVSDASGDCGATDVSDTSSLSGVSDVSGVIVVSGTIRESFEKVLYICLVVLPCSLYSKIIVLGQAQSGVSMRNLSKIILISTRIEAMGICQKYICLKYCMRPTTIRIREAPTWSNARERRAVHCCASRC